MIHFVLNDLRWPTGKGFDAGLEFSGLSLRFDGFVALLILGTHRRHL